VVRLHPIFYATTQNHCYCGQVPEVLAKNYPYLASSSPVRNMAQCLRLASHSGLTRKATSWSKKSLCDGEADEKCNEELNK